MLSSIADLLQCLLSFSVVTASSTAAVLVGATRVKLQISLQLEQLMSRPIVLLLLAQAFNVASAPASVKIPAILQCYYCCYCFCIYSLGSIGIGKQGIRGCTVCTVHIGNCLLEQLKKNEDGPND